MPKNDFVVLRMCRKVTLAGATTVKQISENAFDINRRQTRPGHTGTYSGQGRRHNAGS
jgi:hypothetical protein